MCTRCLLEIPNFIIVVVIWCASRGAGASHNTCLHTYSSFDDMIVLFTVFEMLLCSPTLGQPKKFQRLTRAEEAVITRLWIGHTKATKSHILSRGRRTACHHCGQTLSIDHMLLECAVVQECHDEYYTADSLNTLFETIPETCIVEFLREAGFFNLIWVFRHSTHLIPWITPDLMEFVNSN